MSDRRAEFQADLDRACAHPDRWVEILTPWVGVERPCVYVGVTGVEVLVDLPGPGEATIERRLVLPRPAEHITFHFQQGEP